MTFQPGELFAHYTITEKIGAGGMGEVWRAKDTKLGRDVALKIIPEVFSSDAQRMSRFQREAQVLASLNHPNIAAIYGVEESGGRRALVLELVEGQDISQRLQDGPLPLGEALEIARQIAEALEAAHEKGVVHRDLKPANVKLTPEGTVKVLDFGLAKALEGDPGISSGAPSQSLSPTLTAAATQLGVIIGTAAYMSPEQAKGKSVDRRADIFSFGIVLFEMLSGRPCFGGETVSDTLASVLKDAPDYDRLPPDTPPPVRALLLRCLEKAPRERLRDIGEARILLQKMGRGESVTIPGSLPGFDSGIAAVSEAPAPAGKRRSSTGTWLAALAIATAAAGLAGWWAGSGAEPPSPPRRLAIDHDDLRAGYSYCPVISPDGRRIAYVAEGKLWIRDLASLEPREIDAGPGVRSPFWSHDGALLAWAAADGLKVVHAAGGQPSVLAKRDIEDVSGGAWAEDGTIYLTPSSGPMYTLSPRGGEPQVFVEPDRELEQDFHTPYVLPGDRGLLYTVHRVEGPDTIEVMAGRERRVVLRIPSERIELAVYAPTGHLIFHRRSSLGGIWAVPFSLSTLQTEGAPFLLDPDGSSPSVAADGTLLYAIGGGTEKRQLVLVDMEGKLVRKAGEPQAGIINPEMSWDGTRVAASSVEDDSRNLWVHDIERGTATKLTFGTTAALCAAWAPSDDRVYFCANRGIQVIPADGAGEPETFVEKGEWPALRPGVPWIAYQARSPSTQWDLFYRSLDEGSEPIPFVVAEEDQYDIQIAPGGEYAAYGSAESGQEEIYIKKFPGGEGKWKVSAGGGEWPRWGPRGKRLYYVMEGSHGSSLMKVDVITNPGLSLSRPVKLFGEDTIPGLRLGGPSRQYDLHPNGEQILAIFALDTENPKKTRLVLTENWIEAFGKGSRP